MLVSMHQVLVSPCHSLVICCEDSLSEGPVSLSEYAVTLCIWLVWALTMSLLP